MAVPTAAITDIDNTQRYTHVYGTITIPAGFVYAAGGFVVSLAFDQIKSSQPPRFVLVQSAKAAGAGVANLFEYAYLPGATAALGQVQVFTGAAAQTALTELANGAVPAGVSGDTIIFKAEFPRF